MTTSPVRLERTQSTLTHHTPATVDVQIADDNYRNFLSVLFPVNDRI